MLYAAYYFEMKPADRDDCAKVDSDDDDFVDTMADIRV